MRARKRAGFDPTQAGFRLCTSSEPRGVDVYVPYDRTTGVLGNQGSGKTLDLLSPALMANPGGALVTLTKPDDLLLTVGERRRGARPVAVLDPLGLAPGAATELVWDPIEGCVDPTTAARRAKAFGYGTIGGASGGDDAARFYAGECAKVLQAYFHAAALTGRTLDHVLEWVAEPATATSAITILESHGYAAGGWAGLLRGVLQGDEKTRANTVATVHQAMDLFFQPDIRARCVPNRTRKRTNIKELIANTGTVYMLGREDPYLSVSPLMTALAEHVLDSALELAYASRYGRVCPSFLAVLDEMPSTAPIPTLMTRMANERALGICIMWAAQNRRQLVTLFGENGSGQLAALTNNLVIFGGSNDGQFNKEISDLLGQRRVIRESWSDGPSGRSRSGSAEREAVIRPEEIRLIPERHALIVGDRSKPFIGKLTRCIDGPAGRTLLAAQSELRATVGTARRTARVDITRLTATAHQAARDSALHIDNVTEDN